ncbi:hypothetical protein HPB52_004968 [Rhipicephalus sanguineus]|uniref:Clustered mitochondria protein N-terminal domain-containing protein n=1 Tax=Rhipicephalus sanguineus TaxID=34632 RepID=A0A9D4STB6_RHISA|nr:hypothetical protein HPB52_004968 [Rhipicephalus sanguineus]
MRPACSHNFNAHVCLQVSSMELVQEIYQLLMYYEDTCHRTSFSLQLDGITLDNFAELKNIPGLDEGSLIKMVEEPYTVREACVHVRNLLRPLDPDDAYNGLDCSSLAFLNVVMQGDDIVGDPLCTLDRHQITRRRWNASRQLTRTPWTLPRRLRQRPCRTPELRGLSAQDWTQLF